MTLRLLLGGLLMAASCLAHAFDSWEHKQLGDLAYHIAIDVYCKHNQNLEPCKSRYSAEKNGLNQLYDPLLTDLPHGAYHKQAHRTSYGDVVMCVDYFLTPDKLIAGRERSLISSNNQKMGPDGLPLPDEAPVLFPTLRSQLDLDEGSRCKDELDNLEGARAGHVNHTHFQAELLVAQRHNHIIALSMRTMEDNLFSALVMNAVSDHFLQDSFAPGHISTWRSRLTDLAANAYHDRVNRKGWDAAINADKLKTMATANGKDNSTDNLIGLIYKELSEDILLRRAFFEPDEPDACTRNCRPREATLIDRYQQELSELFKKLPTSEESLVVTLRGDSDLWRREQDRQRLVMLLFDVRSILDVLESQPSAEPGNNRRTVVLVDSFKESGWKWHFMKEQETTTADAAPKTPKPRIRWLEWEPSVIQANVGPLYYGGPKEAGMPFAPYAQEASLKYTSMDQVFGISVGADNMAFGDAQTRYVANLETVVWGSASAKRRNDFNSGNYAVTVGIQPYISRNDKGVALSGRAMMVMPAVEASVSVPVRLLHLKTNNGHSEWLPTIGLRVDAGFTSFLTFYLQGIYDGAAQRDGTIRRGLSLGAGIQLAAPTCRLPVIKGFACKE
jgi:hypothetical protein